MIAAIATKRKTTAKSQNTAEGAKTMTKEEFIAAVAVIKSTSPTLPCIHTSNRNTIALRLMEQTTPQFTLVGVGEDRGR